MKKIIALIGFLLLSFMASLVLPWYSIAFIAAAFAFLTDFSPVKSLLMFFIAGFILWITYALIIDHQAASRLSVRIAILFGIQKVFILLIVTGMMGGITGGLGAWTGSLLRKYINAKLIVFGR